MSRKGVDEGDTPTTLQLHLVGGTGRNCHGMAGLN